MAKFLTKFANWRITSMTFANKRNYSYSFIRQFGKIPHEIRQIGELTSMTFANKKDMLIIISINENQWN